MGDTRKAKTRRARRGATAKARPAAPEVTRINLALQELWHVGPHEGKENLRHERDRSRRSLDVEQDAPDRERRWPEDHGNPCGPRGGRKDGPKHSGSKFCSIPLSV